MDAPEFDLRDALKDRDPGAGAAKVLLLGGPHKRWASIARLLDGRGHRCMTVERLDEARSQVARRYFDLVLIDPEPGDDDGLQLLSLLQRTSPSTKTIIVGGDLSPVIAIRAMQQGAVDYVTDPIDEQALLDRIDSALIKSRLEKQREEKLARLKTICRELNTARHEVSQQVDALCQDLVSAYEGIAEQMNEVEMTSEFRTLVRQELDVESVLRTMLEYMLTRTGPTNAAVFLPELNGEYSLGAYVNYDCPADAIGVLLDHLGLAVCPQMVNEREMISFDDADEFAEFIGADAGILSDSQVLAFPCRHEHECLAVVVLFRNRKEPFTGEVAGTLEILRALFAEQLARVIKVHHRAEPEWPDEAVDDELDFNDDFGFGGVAA